MNLFTRITTFVAGSLAVLSILGFYYNPDLFAWYEITKKISTNFFFPSEIGKILVGGIGEIQVKVLSAFTMYPPEPKEDMVLAGRIALGGSIAMLASSFLDSGILNGLGTLVFGFVVVNSYLSLASQVDSSIIAQPRLGFFLAVAALVLNILGTLTSNTKRDDA